MGVVHKFKPGSFKNAKRHLHVALNNFSPHPIEALRKSRDLADKD